MRICTDCQSPMEEEVLKSKLGYYVGYNCKCGLYERISKYWPTKELADGFLELVWEAGKR